MNPSTIQSTFSQLLQQQPSWQGLPHRLKLVATPNGVWDDFIRLWPNRDLPAFVHDALPVGHELSNERLACFSAAHHYAAMFGIVTDRIVDGQVFERDLLPVRESLLRCWTEQLGVGLGDRFQARHVIGQAMRAWKRGTDLERSRAGKAHDWDTWGASVTQRLQWVSTSAISMLEAGGAWDAAGALGRTYDQFMMALQIFDDRADQAEDLRERGVSFEVEDGDPRQLPALLLFQAAATASASGLYRLGGWICDFARLLVRRPGTT